MRIKLCTVLFLLFFMCVVVIKACLLVTLEYVF